MKEVVERKRFTRKRRFRDYKSQETSVEGGGGGVGGGVDGTTGKRAGKMNWDREGEEVDCWARNEGGWI